VDHLQAGCGEEDQQKTSESYLSEEPMREAVARVALEPVDGRRLRIVFDFDGDRLLRLDPFRPKAAAACTSCPFGSLNV